MNTFTIDTDNSTILYLAAEDVPTTPDFVRFSSQKEFEKAAKAWPIGRLAAIWNELAGAVPFDDLKPVSKFTDRQTGITRIWNAIQRLKRDVPETPAAAPTLAAVAPRKRKATEEATPAPAAPTAPVAREGSKKAIVLDMLKRPEGATLQEIMSVTGWMAHSVRGFISGGLGKKMGLAVESLKTPEGARAYRINAQ